MNRLPRDPPDPERDPIGIGRIDPKFRPVWERASPGVRRALASYFLPARSTRAALAPTRPRLVKWYCPFAHQAEFPSGHRYCINVYTGCAHRCVYCYASAYMPRNAAPKPGFERALAADLRDLDRFDLPPAPVHISNSTDPLQPLEIRLGHTRRALEAILEHRSRFSTVVLLTRNPSLAARLGMFDLLHALGAPAVRGARGGSAAPRFLVEVSIPFHRETARRVYDPGAPSIGDRIDGLRALREAGIPAVLRIDPLFPRSPIDAAGTRLSDLGLVEPQTPDDLAALIGLARDIGALHVVASTAKLTRPRAGPMPGPMRLMRDVYERMSAPGRPVFRGGSWRLPDAIARRAILDPFLALCRDAGVAAMHCRENLLGTR